MGCSLCPAGRVDLAEEPRLETCSADTSPDPQAKEKPAGMNLIFPQKSGQG
jgi:hypothetical protein